MAQAATRMTADELASSILQRQGVDASTPTSPRVMARLTAKQASYLFALCQREHLLVPVTRGGRREAMGGLWDVHELKNGSAILTTYNPSALLGQN